MTDNALPAPLVPAEVDLRDFATMPLAVQTLRDSRFASEVTPEAFRAGVLLWCAAWHQVPAGSLPNNDAELAKLAGYGFVVKEWRKVKTQALTKFTLCSDGRWYHEEVAERATTAWRSRLEHYFERAKERLRKANKARNDKQLPPLRDLTFDQWNEQRLAGSVPMEKAEAYAGIPPEVPAEPPPTPPGIPPENALKGKGEGTERERNGKGEGTERERESFDSSSAPAPAGPDDLRPRTWQQWQEWFDAEQGVYVDPGNQQHRAKFRPLAMAWVNAQLTVGQMRAAIAKAKAEATEPIAYLPSYVDRVLASMVTPPKRRPAAAPTEDERRAENARTTAEAAKLLGFEETRDHA